MPRDAWTSYITVDVSFKEYLSSYGKESSSFDIVNILSGTNLTLQTFQRNETELESKNRIEGCFVCQQKCLFLENKYLEHLCSPINPYGV